MSFEVGCGAESLLTYITLMWLLSRVYKVVLLKVCQLREALDAHIALEGSLSRMRPEVYLEVGQLTKGLVADITFVVHLAIFLLQWIWQ